MSLSKIATRELEKRVRKVAKAREAEADAWKDLKQVIVSTYEDRDSTGATYESIGDVVGVTKARIFQIVSASKSDGSAVTQERELVGV